MLRYANIFIYYTEVYPLAFDGTEFGKKLAREINKFQFPERARAFYISPRVAKTLVAKNSRVTAVFALSRAIALKGDDVGRRIHIHTYSLLTRSLCSHFADPACKLRDQMFSVKLYPTLAKGGDIVSLLVNSLAKLWNRYSNGKLQLKMESFCYIQARTYTRICANCTRYVYACKIARA